MKKEDFFDFASLLSNTFQKKKMNNEGEKIVWKNIKWLRYSKSVGVLMYKESLDEEADFKTIDLRRKGVRKNKKIKMPPTLASPNAISEERKQNLLDLIPYIDETFHDFYRNLVTKHGVQDPLLEDDVVEESED